MAIIPIFIVIGWDTWIMIILVASKGRGVWKTITVLVSLSIFYNKSKIARHFVHYSECLTNPSPFSAIQINNPFLNSRISASHDKGLGF